jgi:hypothetical protein
VTGSGVVVDVATHEDLESKVDRLHVKVDALLAALQKWEPLLERYDPETSLVAGWAARRSAKKKPCKCHEQDG